MKRVQRSRSPPSLHHPRKADAKMGMEVRLLISPNDHSADPSGLLYSADPGPRYLPGQPRSSRPFCRQGAVTAITRQRYVRMVAFRVDFSPAFRGSPRPDHFGLRLENITLEEM